MKYKKSLLLLFLANTISGLSQGISMIAIPWYYSAVLGEQSRFGIYYGFLTLVSTVWSIYAGTLVDRYNRKRIMVLESILGFVVLSLAFYLGKYTAAPLWVICGIVFSFTALLYNIHYVNIYSIAQELTTPEEYKDVLSTIEVQGQATTVLGGALAAILLEGSMNGRVNVFGFSFHIPFELNPWDLYEIFGLDAITYLIAVFIFMAIVYVPRGREYNEDESAWKRLQLGWRFLRSKPALLSIGWGSTSVFVCVLLVSFFLMPSYVSHFLKEESHVFASSELYFALGALSAGFTSRYAFKRWHEVWRILLFMSLALVVFLVFSFNRNLYLFYGVGILFGYCNAAIRFNRVSYFWKVIPNHLMGRASSVINISAYIFRAIWGFIFSLPFFVGEVGIQRVMICLFFFILLCTWIVYRFRNQLQGYESMPEI